MARRMLIRKQDKIKVLYHANCADGFTSAWIVKKYFDEQFPQVVQEERLSFWACNYNQPVPCELDENSFVIMVDFCYTPDVMKTIFNSAERTIVLDHHKTAIERMAPFIAELEQADLVGVDTNYYLMFDMEKSGAGITWDFFFGDTIMPELVKYVQDRDLWKFNYPETRNVNAALFSYEYTFANWDMISVLLEDPHTFNIFTQSGKAIERKHFKDINEMIDNHTNFIIMEGYKVPIITVPYMWSSDACHILARRYPESSFAAAFWFIKKSDNEPAVQFSLRSIGDFDVSAVAQVYGGGGHQRAAGFIIDFLLFSEMLKDFLWVKK